MNKVRIDSEIFRIVEERIAMHRRIDFFLPPLMHYMCLHVEEAHS